MILLQASHIQKSFAGDPILRDASITIQDKDRSALIGINGAGKSTLFKIIAGQFTPDTGDISISKQATIGYLAQTGSLDTEQTIFTAMRAVFQHISEMESQLKNLELQMGDEEILGNSSAYEKLMQSYSALTEAFEEAGGYAVDAKIRGVLHGLGFPEETHQTIIHTLSGGQKTRLALCKLLLQEPSVLLLDEPTNYLDMDTVQWLEQYLRQYQGAVLVISHDRYFIDHFANAVYELNDGVIKQYKGNYTDFLKQKEAELEQTIKLFEQQQGEIARLEDFVRRNIARASTSKRAQSKQKLLDKIERIDKPTINQQVFFSFETAKRSGNDVLQGTQLGSFLGDRWIFRNLHLEIRRGDRIALLGPNGIGKSTLIKSLIGELPLAEGYVQLGANVQIGYYDQEHSSLSSTSTILQEVWNEYPALDRTTVRSVLGQFLFSGEEVEKLISSLSGGEKARVLLAKLMLKQANFLILDEPTNHLDLLSKEILEEALANYDGTLLFISHDRYFINKLANRVIELTPLGMKSYLGNYDDFVEKKAQLLALQALQNTPAMPKNNESPSVKTSANQERRSEDKQRQREERKRKRQIEEVEQKISELEDAIAWIEQQLCDPATFADPEQSIAINTRYQELQTQLETLFVTWEELQED
ncbi:ABC-F family ATP-binding cassette domain-containing protein [Fodinisporobacter ferrooxydans]|uniref:ABC-F family ATP-binding cassette domain-containing protein n=1 Tax=Fodinisporobacter ferrooxydans TaxID=2901836 RepID=A0ABY4CNX6_9BACL|nr:ABC-F family ATP-binding cassette domain-containing protein [Alicyclobacillaceae bacterium MYW30-H2]